MAFEKGPDLGDEQRLKSDVTWWVRGLKKAGAWRGKAGGRMLGDKTWLMVR